MYNRIEQMVQDTIVTNIKCLKLVEKPKSRSVTGNSNPYGIFTANNRIWSFSLKRKLT
jgi:hypothetical protein